MAKVDVLTKVKAAAGGTVALAQALGIVHSAVSHWKKIPVARVLEIERITGVLRWEQRPDIYPPPDRGGKKPAPANPPRQAGSVGQKRK
jgi:DNA-binding transcriptional regulator YdaS (Cro superfamily)